MKFCSSFILAAFPGLRDHSYGKSAILAVQSRVPWGALKDSQGVSGVDTIFCGNTKMRFAFLCSSPLSSGDTAAFQRPRDV